MKSQSVFPHKDKFCEFLIIISVSPFYFTGSTCVTEKILIRSAVHITEKQTKIFSHLLFFFFFALSAPAGRTRDCVWIYLFLDRNNVYFV